ncbi:Uncharacterised protein [Brucella anthropi]|nr:Uncharacterised protein [Brucella anthropi]
MAKVRKEVAVSSSPTAESTATPPIVQTMPPKDDVSAEYDAGPVGNLENPGPYIAQVSKQTKFALTCKDDEGDRIRVAGVRAIHCVGFPIFKSSTMKTN